MVPYKWLTRNPEVGNAPVWFLSNIWRLGRVRNLKFGKDVSNKILLNTAKCQGHSIYRFWIIKRKPIVILLLDPTQIRVNNANNTKIFGCVWWNYHTKHLAILKNEIESSLSNLFGIIIHQNNFLKYLYHQCLWPIKQSQVRNL